MKFEDFLGNTVEAGDTILYAAMSGRSVQMVKAKVLAIREKTVTVEPMDCARWKQHWGREKYLDDKGKPFDPYGPNRAKHIQRESGYILNSTGEFHTSEFRTEVFNKMRAEWYSIHKTPMPWKNERDIFSYAPEIWKDYVKIEKVKTKVTLQVLQNIVLIEKASASSS